MLLLIYLVAIVSESPSLQAPLANHISRLVSSWNHWSVSTCVTQSYAHVLLDGLRSFVRTCVGRTCPSGNFQPKSILCLLRRINSSWIQVHEHRSSLRSVNAFRIASRRRSMENRQPHEAEWSESQWQSSWRNSTTESALYSIPHIARCFLDFRKLSSSLQQCFTLATAFTEPK